MSSNEGSDFHDEPHQKAGNEDDFDLEEAVPISNRQARKAQLKLNPSKPNKKGSKIENKKFQNTQDVDLPQDALSTTVALPYCQSCGFPVDYCDFSPSWEYCKKTALTKYPEFYTCYLEANKSSPTSTQENKTTSVVSKQIDSTTGSQVDQKTLEPMSEEGPVKPKSAKTKIVQRKMITIQKNLRAKNKLSTSILGLDAYDIKLDSVAKLLKKKFACGCSVVKGGPGTASYVELQGDFENDLESILLSNYPEISEEAIVHSASKG